VGHPGSPESDKNQARGSHHLSASYYPHTLKEVGPRLKLSGKGKDLPILWSHKTPRLAATCQLLQPMLSTDSINIHAMILQKRVLRG
jgi:hypothetical protein